ncbi:g6f-like [Genypterus blacodes]|uniref:g6f-like n=1 Tax=Genypterus blacodes TaxID=154954 RepID=UPI003F76DF13
MEFAFLTVILVSSSVVLFSHFSLSFTERDWDDVVVTKVGSPTTLVCNNTALRGAIAINWKMKSLGADQWKLVLSASEREKFSGGSSKASMRLTDPDFQNTGVFSLFFVPKMKDGGLYSCLIKWQERKVWEKTVLLAVLTVTIIPPSPIPQHSTLRLIASVNPDSTMKKVTWSTPGGIAMKSQRLRNTGTVAKLPYVEISDTGAYTCMVQPLGNSARRFFAFNVEVTVDVNTVASSTKTPIYDTEIKTANLAQKPFTLLCPAVQGDYVQLYWQPPDTRIHDMKEAYRYDRWRNTTVAPEISIKRLQLAGSPYNAQAGSFSFILTGGIKAGGLYICNVFLNDNAFSQRILLSVLKVKGKRLASKLELLCEYSELSQVRGVVWTHQNDVSRRSVDDTTTDGIHTMVVPLPITPDLAGDYTCTMQLENWKTVSGTYTVTLPPEESVGDTTPSLLPSTLSPLPPTPPLPSTPSPLPSTPSLLPSTPSPLPPTHSMLPSSTSLLPSLSALLLLVPLVATAVGVLLWRQKHISDRGMEQSQSMHSGGENIYENPEDIRHAPPQGSVYMDLKPMEENDVYKELERFECQS